MPENNRVYLSPPETSSLDRELLLDAFDSNWIAPLGPHVDAFEREFASLHGARHAVALSSGTAALHLSLLVAGVRPGDEVLCPTLTFAATANAIRYCSARPVFLDSEAASWNVDPALVADELDSLAHRGRPRPAAVVAVDLFGQPADYGPIRAACRRHGVPLVIDAAESLGARYGGRPTGTQGDIGCFSFNGNKIITTSGGGMVVTDREDWADRIRHLATQAKDPAPHYEHSEVGYNYRLSNLLAALGRGQLSTLEERVAKRQAIFCRYAEALAGLPGVEMMPEPEGGAASRWLSCLTIDRSQAGIGPTQIIEALATENIEARPLWKPMHLQAAHHGASRAVGGAVAERLFRDGLCLPSGSSLTAEDQARVVSTVRGAFRSAAMRAA